MISKIQQLIKSGNLDNAAEQLFEAVRSDNRLNSFEADTLVINGNLKDIKKQEKRRKISSKEAADERTRLTWELTDILEEIEKQFPELDSNESTTSPPQPSSINTENNQTDYGNLQAGITINVTNTIQNSNSSENINTNTNENTNINQLTSTQKEEVSDLVTKLTDIHSNNRSAEDLSSEEQEAIDKAQSLATSIQKIEQAETKEELNPYLSKVKTFFDELEAGDNLLGNSIKVAKDGAKTIQSLAKTYNSLASWVGLPTVPKLFTGE